MIINSPQLITKPSISVIICSYNRASTIKQTIDSVLNQEFGSTFEIIIGDDGSKDDSRDILRAYQQKYPEIITLLLQDTNHGLGGNWASCVKLARGKYIASCDDDDYWHNPNKLQLQFDYLQNHPETGMVHTEKDDLYVADKNKLISNVYSTNNFDVPQGYIQKEIFAGKVPICVSTSLIRKELIERYVVLDDYIRLRFNIQDWPTWIILSKYSRIDYLPISTCTYRIGHLAISNLQDYDKQKSKMASDKQMYKYLCDIFPEDLVYDEKDYDIYTYNVLLSLAFKKNDNINARTYAKKLISLGNSSIKVRMSCSILGFSIYRFLKRMKR